MSDVGEPDGAAGSSGSDLDAYERRYMVRGEAVLFHARERRAVVVSAMNVVAAAIGAWAAVTLARSLPYVSGHPFVTCGLLLTLAGTIAAAVGTFISVLTDLCLRVVLSPSRVSIHLGVQSVDVPVASICDVVAERVPAWRVGSSLRRLARRDTVFSDATASAGVRIDWRDARGRPRRTWIYARCAQALAERIRELQAATGVRVQIEAGSDVVESARAPGGGRTQRR